MGTANFPPSRARHPQSACSHPFRPGASALISMRLRGAVLRCKSAGDYAAASRRRGLDIYRRMLRNFAGARAWPRRIRRVSRAASIFARPAARVSGLKWLGCCNPACVIVGRKKRRRAGSKWIVSTFRGYVSKMSDGETVKY